MKKNFCIVILIIACLWMSNGLGYAATKSAPKSQTKLVADFEEGTYAKNPEWWHFDNLALKITKNVHVSGEDAIAASTGKFSLELKGKANDWYTGGLGTYLGIDAKPYTGLQMDIYGFGPKSGSIKVELVDDDDNNWEVIQDPKKGWIPTKDDRWINEVRVDWTGWKRVYLPFSDFVVDNPGSGNGIWDPYQTESSGGLLTLQFISIANSKIGETHYVVDNIKLVGVGEED